MFNKFVLLTLLILANQTSMAETCPSIADIRHHSLKGWIAYDSEDGTTLSKKRATEFKKLVKQFALAEWKLGKSSKDGAIRCYYLDKSGSNLEAYLAKDHFEPVNNKNYWYQVSGYTQCAAGKGKCEFRKHIFTQQLARR